MIEDKMAVALKKMVQDLENMTPDEFSVWYENQLKEAGLPCYDSSEVLNTKEGAVKMLEDSGLKVGDSLDIHDPNITHKGSYQENSHSGIIDGFDITVYYTSPSGEYREVSLSQWVNHLKNVND